MNNFVQDYIDGKCQLDDIDDYVDKWHQYDNSIPLYLYLGMTHQEYGEWVKDPTMLVRIINTHRNENWFL